MIPSWTESRPNPGESAPTRAALSAPAAGGVRGAGCAALGNVEGLAEVDQRGSVWHAELGEAAGDADLLPTGVVVVRRGPMLLLAEIVFVIPVFDEVAILGPFSGRRCGCTR